ncbi:MAG: type II secretion system F family protein [Candidatus Omnitrophica bacterium]|nr:type II secretion system F family protein [Candidatus Omnitrophota bacterium]
MPNFLYTARTKQGKLEKGFFEAKNENDLIDTLQARELIILSIEQAARSKTVSKKDKHLHSKAKLDDMILFGKQLTSLVNAGITLLRSLEICSEQITSKQLHIALLEIKKDVAGGSSLKDALAKHPKIFSKFWVNIIETGETTGQLGFALEQLTQYLETSATFMRKIIGALMYPAIILCVAIGAILVFILRIIPMFENIYNNFGAQLPLFTQIIFNMSKVAKNGFLPGIGIIIGCVFLFRAYRHTHAGRRNIDNILLQLPLIGTVIKNIAAVRFARGLSMLVKSGTPILHAMDIIIETSGNVIIMEMLSRVKESVKEGKTMSAPLIESGLFPDMLSHMVGVGEESGELANILEKAALFYQERVDAYVTRLTTLFEPALIIFVGLIVGTLIIAMYLPIFGLAGAVAK